MDGRVRIPRRLRGKVRGEARTLPGVVFAYGLLSALGGWKPGDSPRTGGQGPKKSDGGRHKSGSESHGHGGGEMRIPVAGGAERRGLEVHLESVAD